VTGARVLRRSATIGRLTAAVCVLGAAFAAVAALSMPSFNTSGGIDLNEPDELAAWFLLICVLAAFSFALAWGTRRRARRERFGVAATVVTVALAVACEAVSAVIIVGVTLAAISLSQSG
jgi:drug/metabolite transporter (DMT)-like permease